MRILHILDHSIPLHSGYSFRTRHLLDAQRAMGWHTAQLTGPKQGPNGALEEEVDQLHFYRTQSDGLLSRLPLLNHWQLVRSLAARIQQVARREKPDVLHAHSPALNGLAGLLAARRLKLPLVYECRAFWEDAAVDHGTSGEGGPRYRLSRQLETHVFRQADAITTICEGLRGEIAGRGIEPRKITVIPNGVDPTQFSPPSQYSAPWAPGADETLLGFAGSFYAYEGLPLLLEALVQVRRRHPRTRLLLVGGGPQEALLRERVAALGLEDAVDLPGRVPHHQIAAYYDAVDIFVYPRLPMRLTDLVTPLKPLEAMAWGKLVVASDVGGHRELIRDGETGLLFAAGSAEALADKLDELIAGHHDPARLRAAARQFVEQERTWERSAGHYARVYGDLT